MCHIDVDSNDNETKTTSKSANHQSTAEHLNNTETCSSENCSTFGLTKMGLRIGNLNVYHLVTKIDEIPVTMLLKERRTVDILRMCETFSIRRIIYKFLNVCPFDYTVVAVSWKVERL